MGLEILRYARQGIRGYLRFGGKVYEKEIRALRVIHDKRIAARYRSQSIEIGDTLRLAANDHGRAGMNAGTERGREFCHICFSLQRD